MDNKVCQIKDDYVAQTVRQFVLTGADGIFYCIARPVKDLEI